MSAKAYGGKAGISYGHVPGHQYHDVDVVLTQSRAGGWRMVAIEKWGSAQGYDEEHGRNSATGYGDSPTEAASNLRANASAIQKQGYLESAISKALEAWEKDADEATT